MLNVMSPDGLSVSESVSASISQSVSQSVSQSASQSVTYSLTQSISRSVAETMHVEVFKHNGGFSEVTLVKLSNRI